MSIKSFLKSKMPALSGKRVAISGSTGGIGRELCMHLGAYCASLVLVDRNMEKSHSLAADLREKFPTLEISHIKADMADMESVVAAGDALAEMDIDFLILNAGAYSIPRYTCDTGYDNVFQINFISPYYLARRLISGIRARGGKIVAVGSIAHNYSKIDPADVDFSTRKKASLVYGNAKRYLTYSLFELAAEGGIAIAHPGISFTGITAHYPKLIFAIIKYPMKLIFMHPRKACLSVIYALTEPCGAGEWVGPWLFDVWGMPRKKPLKTAKPKEAKEICRIAEEIYQKVGEGAKNITK